MAIPYGHDLPVPWHAGVSTACLLMPSRCISAPITLDGRGYRYLGVECHAISAAGPSGIISNANVAPEIRTYS